MKCLCVRVFFALFIILGGFGGAIAMATAPFSDKPFWEGKPKLETKLREERAILVSVRTEKGEVDKKADLFVINGVGHVRRDAESVFTMAQQIDRLKEISEVFRTVNYEAKTKRVFVVCEALGYQARMLIQVDPSLAPIREIRFKVVEGHFNGLEGVVAVRELGLQTEVSLRVRHEAREIPIPKVLVGVALEILIQQVASKMRTHFENEPVVRPTVKPGSASKSI